MKNPTNFQLLKADRIFYLLLSASVFYFFAFGLIYAFLGRYLLLGIMAIFTVGFSLGLLRSVKVLKSSILLWGIVLLVWAGLRLLLFAVDLLIKPIPEGHIHQQLGGAGLLFSILFLISGIFLIKKRKKVFGAAE